MIEMGWAHSFETLGPYESISIKVGPRVSTFSPGG